MIRQPESSEVDWMVIEYNHATGKLVAQRKAVRARLAREAWEVAALIDAVGARLPFSSVRCVQIEAGNKDKYGHR